MNTLVALAAMSLGQFFVVNPQIPVVQYQSTVAVVNTVRVNYPIYTPYYYTPPVVLYSVPYGLSAYPYNRNFYNAQPYAYPMYRIYP
jgi:hypothetical protein